MHDHRYVQLADGLQLHVRDYPGPADRPPLLCLHGLTRNSRDFAVLAERYSPRFRVIAPDFRGRGESDYDPIPSRYNPLTYAGDVIQILDQLDVPRALFIGTSLGGLVTMTVAAIAPQRIAATVLNDVGPELSSAGLDRIKTYVGVDKRFRSWEEAAEAIAAHDPGLPEHYGRADWLAMARRICREEHGEIRFDYDMAIAAPLRASPTPTIDMWPLYSALARKPLLIVRGEHSDLVTAEAANRMVEVAPGATLVTVPGVGHAPDLAEPAAVAAIDALLERVAG